MHEHLSPETRRRQMTRRGEARLRRRPTESQIGIRMDLICQEQQLHKESDLVNRLKHDRHSEGNTASIYDQQYVMWQPIEHNYTSLELSRNTKTCRCWNLKTYLQFYINVWTVLCDGEMWRGRTLSSEVYTIQRESLREADEVLGYFTE